MKKAYFVIIRGPAGVGKSEVAKKLARDIGGDYLSVDDVLSENGLTKDKEEGYISQKSFKRANELAIPGTLRNLKYGRPVIFDGNFYWKSQIKDLVKRIGGKHYGFTLKADLKECIARDKKRKRGRIGKEAISAVFKKVDSFDYGVVIDVNKKSVREIVREIENYLPKRT